MKRALPRAYGFTLLELLVVILIIGIVTAGVLFSISFAGKDTDLETESKRLLSLMDYAREQAELQTRDYGIYFGQSGYEFVVYDVRTGSWRRVFEDDALRDRTLPSGLDFKLVVDARPIVLNETLAQPPDKTPSSQPGAQPQSSPVPHTSPQSNEDSNADSKSDSGARSGSDPDSDTDSDSGASSFAPQVMIFSSGDLSSFSITVERPSAGRSITLDENQDGNIVQKPMVGGDK
ncbi:MAG TPA: prepilin-type N-terminal cleavage/methylation domain-containing protein [Steroidobacteraceae bacterium]|jgi:general secretion pathway protein H